MKVDYFVSIFAFASLACAIPGRRHSIIPTKVSPTSLPLASGAIMNGPTMQWAQLIKDCDNKCRVQAYINDCQQLSGVVGEYKSGKCYPG